MFLRRIIENLKTQNWTAIAIEFAIVIVGVFLGTQVSNWNQERIEKSETAQLLRAERDQHTKDDDPDFARESAPAVQRFQ